MTVTEHPSTAPPDRCSHLTDADLLKRTLELIDQEISFIANREFLTEDCDEESAGEVAKGSEVEQPHLE